jgi:hypothetical protein
MGIQLLKKMSSGNNKCKDSIVTLHRKIGPFKSMILVVEEKELLRYHICALKLIFATPNYLEIFLIEL